MCQPKNTRPPAGLRASLLDAVARVRADAGDAVGVVITGDVVDSVDTDSTEARDTVRTLVQELRARLGACPIVLMPGNHDRRSSGVISPWSHAMVSELRSTLAKDEQVHVLGADRNEPLASRVPTLADVLDAEVVYYDTTHTLDGKFSAAGFFRAEDLLAVEGIVDAKRPVIVVLHHHLVPTPITDASLVDGSKASWMERTLVERVLPWLVSFGNREELFMTALRAGTALTLFHALRSPMIVLHGHKHYPTARVLHAVSEGDGDILIASAGSAGLLEPYRATGPGDTAYVWPSFNAMWLDGDDVSVETVFFSPDAPKPIVRQSLVQAKRNACAWSVAPVPLPPPANTEIGLDAVSFTLSAANDGFFDFVCDRRVESTKPFEPYDEPIEGPPVAAYDGGDGALLEHGGKSYVRIRANVPTRYRATKGVCRTVEESRRQYGSDDFSPFEWVGLHVRKGAERARVELRGIGDVPAFATITDMHTGQERPLPTKAVNGVVTASVEPCAARRLIRIYFPLTGGRDDQ